MDSDMSVIKPCVFKWGIRCFVTISIFPLLVGCALTGTMWKEADATRMSHPCVVGTYNRDKSRALVVRYELETEWRMRSRPYVYVSVPLAKDGEPAQPYSYKQAGKSIAQIERSLDGARTAVLLNGRLDLAQALNPGNFRGAA